MNFLLLQVVYLEWLCLLGRMIGIILYTVPDLPLRHEDHSSKETDLFLMMGGGIGGSSRELFSRPLCSAPARSASHAHLVVFTYLYRICQFYPVTSYSLCQRAGESNVDIPCPSPFPSPPRLVRRLHQLTVETGRAFAGPPSASPPPSHPPCPQ